jgi:hypothetical protein
LNGRLDGSERACKNLALAGGREWLAGRFSGFMMLPQILEKPDRMQGFNSQVAVVLQSFHDLNSALLTEARMGFRNLE